MTRHRATIIVAQLLVASALAFAIVSTLHVIIAHGGERATFTDKDGHFSGSSITHGSKTDFYDAHGRYEGTATRQGTPSNPLGNVDGSKPFGERNGTGRK
jgi:hypothetical protein